MGNGLCAHRRTQWVIYVYRTPEELIPIKWPSSFSQLHEALVYHKAIPGTALQLFIKDATENVMCVSSETSFQALVPKHKEIHPNVDLYYLMIQGH